MRRLLPFLALIVACRRTKVPARQMVHHARERVRARRTRFVAPPEAREHMPERFLEALEAEDRDAVIALFAPDVTFVSDGGLRREASTA